MNRYNYKLEFTPVDNFYFGSVDYFGEKNSNTYMLKSNLWPQQTTILGMLRKEILIQKGLIKQGYDDDERIELSKLIGGRSFEFKNENKEEQDFGCIKAISPIFIEDDNKKLFSECPNDCKRTAEVQYEAYSISKDNPIKMYDRIKQDEVHIPQFIRTEQEYDPKYGLRQALMGIQDLQLKEIDKRIYKVKQVGINRKQEEGAFYKIISYQFAKKEKLHFTCYINIHESILKSQFVQIGSKHSQFYMKVEELLNEVSNNDIFNNKLWEEQNANVDSFKKLWVLSDTYLSQEELSDINYAIADNKSFKYINNQVGQRKFNTNKGIYQFISRGSVLYCEDIEKVKNAIESYKFLRQIGYNYVI